VQFLLKCNRSMTRPLFSNRTQKNYNYNIILIYYRYLHFQTIVCPAGRVHQCREHRRRKWHVSVGQGLRNHTAHHHPQAVLMVRDNYASSWYLNIIINLYDSTIVSTKTLIYSSFSFQEISFARIAIWRWRRMENFNTGTKSNGVPTTGLSVNTVLIIPLFIFWISRKKIPVY